MPRTSNNDRIIAEFPAVKEIIGRFRPMDKITIGVQRADDALMWRIGEDQRKLQETTGQERLKVENDSLFLAIPQTSLMEFRWPDRRDLESGDVWPRPHEAYVLDVLRGNDRMPNRWPWLGHSSLRTATPMHLIWVIDCNYYEKTDEPWVPGRHLRSELSITVYKSTHKELAASADTPSVENIELTSRALMQGSVRGYPQWRELGEKLSALARRLDQLVYAQGLGQIITDEQISRGIGGQLGDIKLGTYVIAGRMMFQIERGDVLFSCVGSDDNIPSGMGPQGTYGTYAQIELMTNDFITRWQLLSADERKALVRPEQLSIM